MNTVVNRNGRLLGDNTDFGGLRALLGQLLGPEGGERPLSGCKVLILGSGGTSKTARAVCAELGAQTILRVSRTAREDAISYETARERHADAELLINTTPVGMYPAVEAQPIVLDGFDRLRAVLDVIYNPLRSRLVLDAEARGIPALGGLQMLVRQAILACERFTGAPVPADEAERVWRGVLRETRSLVLIGMPGSGKSTVGRLLAQKTGREFVDCDEELVRRAGKPIPAIFASEGEAGFRDRESALIAELALTGGRILSTGGGAIMREENLRRLRQNGSLILLDRPLDQLIPTGDRPLGDSREKLAALWRERRPRYLAAADHVIQNPASAEAAAEEIVRCFP